MFNHRNKDSKQRVSINYAAVPFRDRDSICNPARTLDPSYLGFHKSGWYIKGRVHEDYYRWVNDFRATNLKTGEWVCGNFEGMVYASSYKTLCEFLSLFPYDEWDYYDI